LNSCAKKSFEDQVGRRPPTNLKAGTVFAVLELATSKLASSKLTGERRLWLRRRRKKMVMESPS
jgi:hypothetical protein